MYWSKKIFHTISTNIPRVTTACIKLTISEVREKGKSRLIHFMSHSIHFNFIHFSHPPSWLPMILIAWCSHPCTVPSHLFAKLVCVTNKILQSDRSLCPYEIRSLKEISFHLGRLCSPRSFAQAEFSCHVVRTLSLLGSGPQGEELMPLANGLCWAEALQRSRERPGSRFFSLSLVLSWQTAWL